MASIGTYLNLPHNQIVTVPNGTYTGTGTADLAAPNPPSGGAYDGWLILVSQSPLGAIIDTGLEVHLGPGSWKILFVNFKWQNFASSHLTAGLYMNGATNLDFWSADMSNPVDLAQSNGGYRPRNWYALNGAKARFFGGRQHDTGSNCIMNFAQDVHLEGVIIDNIGPADPIAPSNRWHVNGLGTTNGWVSNLTVASCEIDQRISLDDFGSSGGVAGHTNVLFTDSWVTSPNGVGFEFLDRAGAALPGFDGTFSNLWIFNTKGAPRADFPRVGAADFSPPFTDTTYINIADDSSVHYGTAPPSGTNSPPLVWTFINPSASWRTFPAFDYLPAPTTTTLIRDTLLGGACNVFGTWTRTQEQAQYAKARDFGGCIRTDAALTNMGGGVFGDGVSTLNHITDIVTAGHRRVILLAGPSLPYPDHSTAASFQSQCATAANQAASRLTSLVAPNGPLSAASDVEVIWEFINEPNGNPNANDIVEYSFWLKQFCAGIKGAQPTHKVISGGPNSSVVTNVPGWNTSTHTSGSYPGASNLSNFADDSSGQRRRGDVDWIFEGLNPTVVGTGFDWLSYSPHIDGIGHHAYMGGAASGPYSLQGGTAGVNLTTGSAENGAGGFSFFYASWRHLNRIEAKLDAIGAPAAGIGIYCTETGAGTTLSYNSAKTYENNFVVFNGQGSSSGGGLTWTRPTAYKSTVNNNATTFPSGSWSSSGLPTVNGGESYGTENEMGQHLSNLVKMLVGFDSDGSTVFNDVDGHQLTRIKLLCLFRIYDDTNAMSPTNDHGNGLSYGSGWNYGVLYKNGTEKGTGSNGPYAKLVAEGLLTDPRGAAAATGTAKLLTGAFGMAVGVKAASGAAVSLPVGTVVRAAGGKQVTTQAGTGSALLPLSTFARAGGTVHQLGPASDLLNPLLTAPVSAEHRYTKPRYGAGRRTRPVSTGVRTTKPLYPPPTTTVRTT